MKEKINLEDFKGAQATAFVVLAPKAYYAETIPRSDWIIDFSKALEITEGIEFGEFSELFGKNRASKIISAVGFAIRSKSFEELIDKYLNKYPDAVVVQFGCGLSDRSQRYMGKIEKGLPYYDVDFPEMIALRRKFYEENENYKMIGSDLSNYTWIEDIPANLKKKQFVFVAEGVTPYLREEEMKGLLNTLKENFPGCIIIMDTYTKLKLRSAAKILKRKFNAILSFFNEDPQEIVEWSREGAYVFLEEDNLLFRDDFLNNQYLPVYYKSLMRFFIRWFSWHKGIMRSTVTMVIQLGKR